MCWEKLVFWDRASGFGPGESIGDGVAYCGGCGSEGAGSRKV